MYQKLGFVQLHRADFPVPWIQLTDSALLFMLREDPEPYISLTYYVKDIETVIASLEAKDVEFATKPNPADMINRCRVKSPDGMSISLVIFVDGFKQPAGQTLSTMAPEDFMNIEKYANKACGIFGEFACPVNDLDISLSFWKNLALRFYPGAPCLIPRQLYQTGWQ